MDKRVVDITMWIGPGTKIHSPELYPELRVEKVLTPEMPVSDGRTSQSIITLLHIGTHIDAPLHMFADGKQLNDFPADTFIGTAHIIDLRDKVPGGTITPEDLQARFKNVLEPGQIAVLRTDMDTRFGTDDYFDPKISPYLTPEAAQWLVDQKIKIVAVDFNKDRLDTTEFITTRTFHKNNVLTLCYLANLGAIKSKSFTLVALPLKIKGIESSPVRAIVLE